MGFENHAEGYRAVEGATMSQTIGSGSADRLKRVCVGNRLPCNLPCHASSNVTECLHPLRYRSLPTTAAMELLSEVGRDVGGTGEASAVAEDVTAALDAANALAFMSLTFSR